MQAQLLANSLVCQHTYVVHPESQQNTVNKLHVLFLCARCHNVLRPRRIASYPDVRICLDLHPEDADILRLGS